MGCDIHLHIEIKVNGIWEHYQHPKVNRNYKLFGLMAGVRGEQKLFQPKGLPNDVCKVTKFCYDVDTSQYPPHSASWLSALEISQLEDAWDWKNDGDLEHNIFNSYFFGNSYGGFHKYNEAPDGVENVRFVFWFDN